MKAFFFFFFYSIQQSSSGSVEYRTRYKRYFGTETKLLAQGFPRRAACIGNKAAAKPMLISHFHLHVPFVSLMKFGETGPFGAYRQVPHCWPCIPAFLARLQPSEGHALKRWISFLQQPWWIMVCCLPGISDSASPAKNRPINERVDSLIATFGSRLGLLLPSIPDVEAEPTQTSRSEVIRFYRCFPVWSHWNLPFPLKLFLLPFLLRVEGLMEQKRLHCSVGRDHLNNKFNLCFTVMSLHSSPSVLVFYFTRV